MALTDGILAYWELGDNGEGGVSLVDSTGNDYTLVYTAGEGAGMSLGTSQFGGAAEFTHDGSRLYLQYPIDPSIENLTISGWAYANDTSDVQSIISYFQGFNLHFALILEEGTANGIAFDNFAADLGMGVSASNQTWYFFTIVFDQVSELASLWINGSLAGYNGVENFSSFDIQGLSIGATQDGTYELGGQVAQIGFWNRALSESEILNLYNNGNGNVYPFFASLYYNNYQEDGDWGNLLNWWQDDAFTIQATALPTSLNPVNVYGVVSQNTQGNDQCYCSTANFWASNFGTGLTLQSSGVVNFYSGSVLSGNITDSVSMHDNSYIDIPAVIGGNATFRDASLNTGTINGNATVHYDGGSGTYPIGGTVLGTVTYIGFNFGQTCYFSQIQNGYLASSNNWFLDAERTIPAEFAPDDRNDVVFSGMETITGITGDVNESITYNSISCDGVVFSGYEVNPFTIIATNGITAVSSLFRAVTIESNGSYTNCTFADEIDAATLVGNIVLHSCIGIYTHDSDYPIIAFFNGNIDAYYPTSIASGAVTGTLTRHGYGLQQTCISHCHLDETSGTREVLDLYEEEGISVIVTTGAGFADANNTFSRQNPSTNTFGSTTTTIVFDGNEYKLDIENGEYYYTTDLVDWFCTNSDYNPPPTTASTTSGFPVGYGTGLIGNAARFNYNSLINDSDQLAVEFSVSVWVRFPVVPTDSSDGIVGTGQTYGENFTIYGHANKFVVYFDSSEQPDIQSDPISANTWYHCVLLLLITELSSMLMESILVKKQMFLL